MANSNRDVTMLEKPSENGNQKSPPHSEQANDASPPMAPDGGWGWVIVIASFVVNLIVDGICYTFGIIKTDLVEHFDSTSSTTAWAGSLCAGCYLLVGPVASALSNRFGCRIVCMVGSAIAGIFFLISAFSTNIDMLLITYGVMGGIGFGLMYLPSIVMVGYYFDKNRSLATGITVCGSSTGIFVLAPLASNLVEQFTWIGTNIILAGLILNGIVMGALYRPLPDPKSLPVEPTNYVIEATKKEKRSRTYSIDDKYLSMEESQTAIHSPGSETHYSKESLGSHRAETVHLMMGVDRTGQVSASGHLDVEQSERRRSRQMSKASYSGEEKKPFDRKDALYTGNLSSTREFQKAGGDMQTYISSVRSVQVVDNAGNVDTAVKNSHLGAFGRIMGEMFDVTLLKSPTFIIVCVTGFIVYLGLYTPFVYSVAKAESLGASSNQASYILVVIGIGNTISRIATGFIADLPCVDSVLIYNVAAILAGAITCLVAVFNTYPLLIMYGALFGVSIASFITLRSIIIVELLGIEKLNNGFGLMCLAQGIAAIVGSPISGFLYDTTGSYTLPFVISGLMLALGGILCLPIRRIALWEKNRQMRASGFVNAEPSTAATTPS